jgi:hypothetical protein
MRILSWNCRGVGRAPTRRTLKVFSQFEGPNVFFMFESKVKSPKINHLKVSMGFAYSFCVDCVGRAGGLALFWKSGVDLEIVLSNINIIATLNYSDPPDCAWLLIVVHGPPYFAKLRSFWALMEELVDGFSGP